MASELQQRLDALSIPEMRRRVDRAVAHVREMRRAFAVEAGMILEEAPGVIPSIDLDEGRRVLQELMEMLPLLQEPLTPEERAELRPVSAAQIERQKEILDELATDPAGFDATMEQAGLAFRHEQVVKMREEIEKTEMMGEMVSELGALLSEMKAYREHLEADVAEMRERMRRGPTN